MSKSLSAKYYQENKERLQKNLVKDVKIRLKRKEKRSNNVVVNIVKTFQKMKSKRLLNIKKVL